MVHESKRAFLDFWKSDSFLLINKHLLFQYSERICAVPTRAIALQVAQNDHVVAVFPTRIKLAVKSQGTRQKKRINIETIENG